MLHLFISDIHFTPQKGKQCAKHAYQPSYSKADAIKKCSFDDTCYGVYDDYCDDKPPFHLCPKLNDNPFALEESILDPQSCVYLKEGRQKMSID